ncbi:MAG: DUF1491 family protein [Rhodobacteraceae bacterium]|nr:DUF1491 family protein [Paracoccaceae bacterium]
MNQHLRTAIWVRAYLSILDQKCLSAYVLSRGDPDYGTVLVKVTDRNRQARLMQRGFDLARDQSRWLCVAEGTDIEIDPVVEQQRRCDEDLWVLEVDSPDGEHFLLDD